MIDQIIEPVTRQAAKTAQASHRIASSPARTRSYSRYRVDKVIDQAVGKRTLLATDINSQAKVVLKLVLFSPDLLEEEREQRLFQQQDRLSTHELPTSTRYLASFEAKTLLGEGLVLVKPYVEIGPDEIGPDEIGKDEIGTNETDRDKTDRDKIGTEDGFSPISRPKPKPGAITKASIHPRRSYSAFRVRATQQKLEIQFPEARITEGILSNRENATRENAAPTQSLENWLSVVLSTVVFVGGTVALTSSALLGTAVAALLPLAFRKVTTAVDNRRTAIIRLTTESSDRTFLSLITLLPPVKDRNGKINGASQESTLHGSRLSVKRVELSSTLMLMPGYNPLMAQLNFSFYNPTDRCTHIRIVGSCEEIRWVSHQLAQWRNQIEK
ncbi:MAG: hypothetical protein WA783_14760 [Phormidesmis sp.]